MKWGAFVLGAILGACLGAAGAVMFLEWAVRQHYDRATAAEGKAWDCQHELAVTRSWANLGKKKK